MSGDETVTDHGNDTQVSGDGQAQEPQLLARGTCLGRYLIADMLGRGGMGTVYRAFDPDLNRPVALKLMSIKADREDNSRDLSLGRARLLREAQALAQLSHPNVVTVHDVGVYQDSVFVAMELIEGQTLKDWLKDKTHSRAEIISVLSDAGRGLSAAHKAGIIHRDFKTANVILGNDGRVRVLDFGLARASQASDEDEDSRPPNTKDEKTTGSTAASLKFRARMESSSAISGPIVSGDSTSGNASGNLLISSLTHDGSIVGTPNYMSPEQHLGDEVTEWSDQYSFSVVAFEALYGKRPFSGKTLTDMILKMTQGRIAKPKDHTVPEWLAKVIRRGLHIDPEARYPSMDALLAALADDPAIARAKARATRIRWLSALTVLASIFLAAFGLWYGSNRDEKLCLGAEAELVDVWDPSTKQTVQKAFAATVKPFSDQAWSRVDRILDAYAQDWTQAHQEACRATRVQGTQSEDLLDLRMVCLSRRLKEMRALVQVFAQADDEVVRKAVQATHALTPLARCADIESLTAQVEPPKDEATRAQVEAIRLNLTKARAHYETGKYRQGLQEASESLSAAQKTAYRPLEAECRYLLGQLHDQAGQYPSAVQQLTEAWWMAESVGDDPLKARASTELVAVVGYRQAHFEEGLRWSRHTQAAIARCGQDNTMLAAWHQELGTLLAVKGEFKDALENYQRTFSILQQLYPPDHPKMGAAYKYLGDVQDDLGNFELALKNYRQALAINEKAFGPDHPKVGGVLNNLGVTYRKKGDYDRAREHYQRTLLIWETALGSNHPRVGGVLNNLGVVYNRTGRYHQAKASYERALAIWGKTLGPDHPDLSETYANLGTVMFSLGEESEARNLFARSLSICQARTCEPVVTAGAQLGMAKVLWNSRCRPPLANSPRQACRLQIQDLAKKARAAYQAQKLTQELADVDALLKIVSAARN